MLNQDCPKCKQTLRKEVKLFELEFETNLVNEVMADVLPNQDNTAGTFCLNQNCDAKFELLCTETRFLPAKRTYGDAFTKQQPNGNTNGANGGAGPSYYYQKPEIDSVANGGGQYKRPKKETGAAGGGKGGTGIGKNGCELCGKKRHVKQSTCPNNKNREP